MSNQLWKEKWQRNDISFHQPLINPLLQQYFSALRLSVGDRLLVPLCGKSVDMHWLSDCGFQVVGVEVSQIAIQSYFDALQVIPEKKHHGGFTRWSYQNVQIWCGDIFDLTLADLCHVKLLYDNASLTAFPADVRIKYVRHFSDNLPHDCQILLITDETPDDQQFNSVRTIDSEVTALYSDLYHIDLLHGKDCIKTDPEHPDLAPAAMEEKVYLIRRDGFSS